MPNRLIQCWAKVIRISPSLPTIYPIILSCHLRRTMTYKPIREFIPKQCGTSNKRAKCLKHTYPHQHYILFCMDTPFHTVVNHESSMFECPILDLQDHEICISLQSSGSRKQYPTNKTPFSFWIGIEFGVQTHPIHANLVFLILFELHYCVRPRVEGFFEEHVSSSFSTLGA